MTVDEETPLLAADAAVVNHKQAFERFSRAEKRVIVGQISFCAFIPLFASGSFIPAVAEIARDLKTSPSVVSFSISLGFLAGGLGALAGSTYSTYYGRRPVYLVTLMLLFLGSLGTTVSRNVQEMITFRFIHTLGAAPGVSVAAGVIGDIYKLEERGTAMGILFAAMCLAPAMAPMVGGIISQYYSWRLRQLGIGIAGIVAWFMILLFFPETSAPGARGIDKISAESRKFVFVNPLRPLLLLKSPNLISAAFIGFTILSTNYVLLVPLRYTVATRYEITDPAMVGLLFLPSGIGNMMGAPLAKRLSNRVIVKWRAKRGGVWYPEDRLRASIFPASTLVPMSLIFSGLVTTFVPGTIGLVLNVFSLFVNGLGIDMALSPKRAYVMDILGGRSAEAMAAYHALRNVLIALSIAITLPLVERFGVAYTDAISAFLSILGVAALTLTIKYGTELRRWVDVGYVNAETN